MNLPDTARQQHLLWFEAMAVDYELPVASSLQSPIVKYTNLIFPEQTFRQCPGELLNENYARHPQQARPQ